MNSSAVEWGKTVGGKFNGGTISNQYTEAATAMFVRCL